MSCPTRQNRIRLEDLNALPRNYSNAVVFLCSDWHCPGPKAIAGAATTLASAYGADQVLEWYKIASSRGVSEYRAIKYVYGIVRNVTGEKD